MESTTDWIWAVDMLGSKIFTFGPKSGAEAAVAVRCEAAQAGPARASGATTREKTERCKIMRLPLGRSTRGVCHTSTENASAGAEREREKQDERDCDHRADEPRDERPPAAEEQPDYGHDDRPRHRNENRQPGRVHPTSTGPRCPRGGVRQSRPDGRAVPRRSPGSRRGRFESTRVRSD